MQLMAAHAAFLTHAADAPRRKTKKKHHCAGITYQDFYVSNHVGTQFPSIYFNHRKHL
jgi:hypothetical protein